MDVAMAASRIEMQMLFQAAGGLALYYTRKAGAFCWPMAWTARVGALNLRQESGLKRQKEERPATAAGRLLWGRVGAKGGMFPPCGRD
jgi:hypothetical protein